MPAIFAIGVRLVGRLERTAEQMFLAASAARSRAGRCTSSRDNIAKEDRDFHLEIVRATKNSVFHKVCSVYYVMGERRLPIYFQDPERGRKSHAEHLQIFDALLKRDGNLAQALMSAHLQGVESYWKGLIQGGPEEAGKTLHPRRAIPGKVGTGFPSGIAANQGSRA